MKPLQEAWSSSCEAGVISQESMRFVTVEETDPLSFMNCHRTDVIRCLVLDVLEDHTSTFRKQPMEKQTTIPV